MTEFKEALDTAISGCYVPLLISGLVVLVSKDTFTRLCGAVYLVGILSGMSVLVSAIWLLGLY